jgi:chromosome segregation ATPase
MEENNVATEEISNSPESAPETIDTQSPVSEDAQTPTKTAEEKYKEMLTALREERGRRKQASTEIEELRAKLESLESQKEEIDEEPVTRAEALAELNLKLTQDPSFKDRLDLVEERMTQGMTLEQADNAVLAEIARKMLNSSTSPQTIPQSIKTTALPETTRPKLTGNILKDAVAGKLGIPEAQRKAIERILGE